VEKEFCLRASGYSVILFDGRSWAYDFTTRRQTRAPV